MLDNAETLIRATTGLRWRFRAEADRQRHADELGTVLDQAEHAIYQQLHTVPSDTAGNARQANYTALLDEIQQLHLKYVHILRSNGLRPVAVDSTGDEDHREISRIWSSIVGGQGISISSVPRPIAHGAPTPAPLTGFDTEMLSAHARLLSRPLGRALVGDLVDNASQPTVRVIPFDPELIDMLGGNTVVGAEASADDRDSALAASSGGSGAGSTSTVAVPHKFWDSEGAKEGEPVTPAFLVYGHELIHAQHNKHGINVGQPDEETATVSGAESSRDLHSARNLPVTTEDMLREEHNLPLRGHYT